jgi:CheY-like chemotaxis protein
MQTNESNGGLPLLQIDDSAKERTLVRRAIEVTKVPFVFYEAECFETATPYFEMHQDQFDAKRYPQPALVLLDYDMGRQTGVDFLIWLRGMKRIDFITVAMFTGSLWKHHVAECYANGANYFISKPKNNDRFKEIVRALYQSLVSNRVDPITSLEEFQPDPREYPAMAKSV